MARIMVQNGTRTIDEASMHEEVQTEHKHVRPRKRQGKQNYVAFSHIDRTTKEEYYAYNEANASNILWFINQSISSVLHNL